EPIFCHARRPQLAELESARVLASAPSLPPARARKSSDALDPSPNTSYKLLRGRDLFSDSRSVDFAAPSHKVSGWFHRLFLQQKAADLLAIGKAPRQAHTRLCYCSRLRCYPQLVPVPCNWVYLVLPACL